MRDLLWDLAPIILFICLACAVRLWIDRRDERHFACERRGGHWIQTGGQELCLRSLEEVRP